MIVSAVLISLILLIVLFAKVNNVLIEKRIAPYEYDYYKKVDANLFGGKHLNDIIKLFGPPVKTVPDDNISNDGFHQVFYPNFVLTLNQDNFLVSVTVTSPKYTFGKNKIGVGSSKLDVIIAYTNTGAFTRIGMQDSAKTYQVSDGGTWLTFYFDDNDIVKKIEFSKEGGNEDPDPETKIFFFDYKQPY